MERMEQVNIEDQIAQIEAQLIRLQGALDVWRALREAGAQVRVVEKPKAVEGESESESESRNPG